MEYRFEKLNDNNIKDLVPIYISAFKKNICLEELIKKFDTSFTGLKNVGFIAYSKENEPAAFYGVFPCYMDYNGKKILVCQSGNTMTHENHQRKNLFVTLAKITYEYCKDNGIHLVFGFPNKNSYPGFVNKLNWTHKENIQAYITKTTCLPFVMLGRLLPFLKSIIEKYRTKKLENLQVSRTPFKSILHDGAVNVMDHSADFLLYKTYHKNYLLEINGKKVWVKISDMFLLVGDIEYCEKHNFMELVNGLHRLCFWLGIPHLRFHVSPGCLLEEYLMALAKKHDQSYPIGYTMFSDQAIEMDTVKFTLADYDTF